MSRVFALHVPAWAQSLILFQAWPRAITEPGGLTPIHCRCGPKSEQSERGLGSRWMDAESSACSSSWGMGRCSRGDKQERAPVCSSAVDFLTYLQRCLRCQWAASLCSPPGIHNNVGSLQSASWPSGETSCLPPGQLGQLQLHPFSLHSGQVLFSLPCQVLFSLSL